MPYLIKYILIVILVITQVGALIFLFINPTVSLWLLGGFVLSFIFVLTDLVIEKNKFSK